MHNFSEDAHCGRMRSGILDTLESLSRPFHNDFRHRIPYVPFSVQRRVVGAESDRGMDRHVVKNRFSPLPEDRIRFKRLSGAEIRLSFLADPRD